MKLSMNESMYSSQETCAELVGLEHTSDSRPGYKRVRRGEEFRYVDENGNVIEDEKVCQSFNELAIPPAWEDVWISPNVTSHLLATGRDVKGRKQYIYNPKWRKVRDLLNFYRLPLFGRQLPAIRSRISEQVCNNELTREKVLTVVVDLIQQTYIRVGDEQYAQDNDSYGITTLEDQHAEVSKDKVTFHFIGKSGKEHELTITSPHLAELIPQLQDLPGQQLFQYIDQEGNVQDIYSQDVNNFLKETTGHPFTAKDFRTWGGTRTAFEFLSEEKNINKKKLQTMYEAVADRLKNTKAVSKSHYIHPHLIDIAEEGKFHQVLQKVKRTPHIDLLEQTEIRLIYFLENLAQKKLKPLLRT